MSRTSRLLDLMQLLRRRRAPTAGPELATELGVSLRTLYRDIATLKAQGAEIEGEPGLGYVLRPGFTLPPLMFSDEEIEALALGSRWVAVRADARLAVAADNALAKIRAVVPPAVRERIDSAGLTVPVVTPAEPVAVDLAVVRAAIRSERKVTITYRDNDGRETRRTIWPILIGFFDRTLVVAAWCELRHDYRGFRADRILALEAEDVGYPRKRALMVKDWRARQEARAADGN